MDGVHAECVCMNMCSRRLVFVCVFLSESYVCVRLHLLFCFCTSGECACVCICVCVKSCR